MNLRHLTDRVLLEDTKYYVSKERQFSVKILHHLREIERRRLFSDLGYGSLFDYTVKELGYSEAAAMRRIRSARLLEEAPELETKIEDGTLSLTNLALAVGLFKTEAITETKDKIEIIQQIEGATKKECEKILSSFSPLKDLPKESAKRVSPEYSVIKMNWSDKTIAAFDRIKDIHSHKRLDQDKLCLLIFEQVLKMASNANFNSPAQRQSGNRYIPKSLQRYIRNRDGNRCVNCKSTFKLEFDHIKPYSLGGETSKENLRLLCFSCNQRQRIVAKL